LSTYHILFQTLSLILLIDFLPVEILNLLSLDLLVYFFFIHLPILPIHTLESNLLILSLTSLLSSSWYKAYIPLQNLPPFLNLYQMMVTWPPLVEIYWQELSKKEVMLGCHKSYTILALNCTLKNSKAIISVSGINKRYRNNNID